MRLFMTKVWVWDVPVGPLQFSTSGWRKSALDKLEDGDRVILVGTKGKQTPDDMKGRILGAMEPTKHQVMSLDFPVIRLEGDDKDGGYKWPYGLNNRRAWSFPDRPLLSELTDRRFSMDSAQGIVSLEDEEVERIMDLEWREEKLLKRMAHAEARVNPTKRAIAPPPTTSRKGVMHMRRANAFTYAMKVEGARPSAFKIGWAFDYKRRTDEFNHASMPELGGLRYVPKLYQLWDTARMAYSMEQRLLQEFAENRHPENQEVITGVGEQKLREKWAACFQYVRESYAKIVCDT